MSTEPLFDSQEEAAWHREHCGDFYCPCRDDDEDDNGN